MQKEISHEQPPANPSAPAYPKLSKIYQELNRQNDIIFDAEMERNTLELERDMSAEYFDNIS